MHSSASFTKVTANTNSARPGRIVAMTGVVTLGKSRLLPMLYRCESMDSLFKAVADMIGVDSFLLADGGYCSKCSIRQSRKKKKEEEEEERPRVVLINR